MINIKLKDLKKGETFKRIVKNKYGYTKMMYEKQEYCRFDQKYYCEAWNDDVTTEGIYLNGNTLVIKW